jgi:copper chaperone CopZ
MRFAFVSMAVLFISGHAHAETILASVNGMVCAFCATGIEKSFKKIPVVEKVDVDLEKKLVTLQTKAGASLDDTTIRKTITNAGYAVTGIKRQ